MPTIVADDADGFVSTANGQTWVIAPGVNIGGPDSFAAVAIGHDAGVLVNYGNVVSPAYGYFNDAGNAKVYNQLGGLIAAHWGVTFTAGENELRNAGRIEGIFDNAVQFVTGSGNSTVINTGTISGAVAGIAFMASATLTGKIVNSGLIEGDNFGVWLTGAVGGAPVIQNSGTISGDTRSIYAQNGDRLNVTNTGTLIGDVVATTANAVDSVTNRGTIIGNVLLGSGNDVFLGAGGRSGIVFGEVGNDTMTGGSLADRLDGGAGNDILSGGLGRDILTGGANNDFFVFNTAPSSANVDTLIGFNHVQDTIRLENAVFTKLTGLGTLTNAQFWKSASGLAHDASDRIIYETDTGKLFYDSNGNAAGGRVQIAVLDNHANLTNSDFFII